MDKEGRRNGGSAEKSRDRNVGSERRSPEGIIPSGGVQGQRPCGSCNAEESRDRNQPARLQKIDA